jgi:hypothetical protein
VCKKNVAPWGEVNNTIVDESWGDKWQAFYKGYLVDGIAACLSSSGSNSVPSSWNYGTNCWCKMTGPVVGASWVFYHTYGSNADCFAVCAINCAVCVRLGSIYSCSRTALLAV